MESTGREPGNLGPRDNLALKVYALLFGVGAARLQLLGGGVALWLSMMRFCGFGDLRGKCIGLL